MKTSPKSPKMFTLACPPDNRTVLDRQLGEPFYLVFIVNDDGTETLDGNALESADIAAMGIENINADGKVAIARRVHSVTLSNDVLDDGECDERRRESIECCKEYSQPRRHNRATWVRMLAEKTAGYREAKRKLREFLAKRLPKRLRVG